MTPPNPTHAEIAIRIATAMGWNKSNTETIPACVWNASESAHDAIDILQVMASNGYGYVIDTSCTEPVVRVFKGIRSGIATDPSLPRAIALAVMAALEKGEAGR